MKSLAKARFISLLDLMCCSFGGALLIFLIVLSADPGGAKDNPLLVVRCKRVGGSPQAEVGIKFKGPADETWQWAQRDEAAAAGNVFFSARSAAGSGSEACLMLVRPAPGQWEFRPYLVNYPAGASRDAVRVELDIYGQALDGPPQILDAGRPLHHPGHDEGQHVLANIRAVGD
jgi:hypothetical protein